MKVVAESGLKKSYTPLENTEHMVLSWTETGARVLVTRFLRKFITTGTIILHEEGGTLFTFEGTENKCLLKVTVRVHSPRFYWKVATQADIGLADAYINGDISFADKNEGLLNLFEIFNTNIELKASISKINSKRGWWTPMLLTSGLSSAMYFFQHVTKRNTITQARHNISRHYDMNHAIFSLFMDETMQYSAAIFKHEDEDLKVAQQRKLSMLIKKSHIRLLLCDYRQLPESLKFDRIISCEMLEAVGHEYMEKFFSCVESALSENGIFVIQFSAMPDAKYEEHRQSSDFLREYIFPGGLVPSLSRVTSAMASASRLSVEHVVNIGIHQYHTMKRWRRNFLENERKILELGFDEKFVRTWIYYFDYCGAGFKSCTLGNYQIVFSRPGNVSEFGDISNHVQSAY